MLPETGVDDFKITLRILGGSVKKLKTNQKDPEEEDPDETISEILSEISRRSSQRSSGQAGPAGEDEQVFSQ